MKEIKVKGIEVKYNVINENDYICLTDIARFKTNEPDTVIGNWMRNRNTVEFLGTWEILNNPDFNPTEFDGFKKQAGLNAFVLSPQKERIIRLNKLAISQMETLNKSENRKLLK